MRWVLAVIGMTVAAACSSASTASVVDRALPAGLGPPPVIDAHDGSIVQDGSTFWIFGTAYACGFGLNRMGTRWCGINAFSSTDLRTWTPRGQPVAPDALWQQRCAPPRFGCFRPHVARSATTGGWVMWINTYDIAAGYRVLTAPSPAGSLDGDGDTRPGPGRPHPAQPGRPGHLRGQHRRRVDRLHPPRAQDAGRRRRRAAQP